MRDEAIFELVSVPRFIDVALWRGWWVSFRVPFLRKPMRKVGYRGRKADGTVVEALDLIPVGAAPKWREYASAFEAAANRSVLS